MVVVWGLGMFGVVGRWVVGIVVDRLVVGRQVVDIWAVGIWVVGKRVVVVAGRLVEYCICRLCSKCLGLRGIGHHLLGLGLMLLDIDLWEYGRLVELR